MLEVKESYTEDRDPQLNSLQKYSDLAAQHDLIKEPVKVERGEGDAPAKVTIVAKFGDETFTFSDVPEAVHWLAFVYHVGEHAVENAS